MIAITKRLVAINCGHSNHRQYSGREKENESFL